MKLESFSEIDNKYYIVMDAEAAEYIASSLYHHGLSQMNLLAARNRGKFIIDPEDVPEIQRINETMDLMVNANKLKERAKKKASEEAL